MAEAQAAAELGPVAAASRVTGEKKRSTARALSLPFIYSAIVCTLVALMRLANPYTLLNLVTDTLCLLVVLM